MSDLSKLFPAAEGAAAYRLETVDTFVEHGFDREKVEAVMAVTGELVVTVINLIQEFLLHSNQLPPDDGLVWRLSLLTSLHGYIAEEEAQTVVSYRLYRTQRSKTSN